MTRRRALAILAATAACTASLVLAAPSPVAADTTVIYDGNGPGSPHIGIIGDSVMSGIRWTGSYANLGRFNFTFDAESCRRTIAASCRGREGYAPENALTILQRRAGQWGNVLVMTTGYNDPGTQFPSAVDAIMAEAASQGIGKVVWLTMRTADVTYVSPGYRSNSYTFRDNNRILLQKAQEYAGALQIADWATYSAAERSWVGSDGVHLSVAGAHQAAAFIAEVAAQVMAGNTITPAAEQPAADGWISVRRGDRGAQVAMVQSALIRHEVPYVPRADGVFGRYTELAVIVFQRHYGLPTTGVVDSPTATLLFAGVDPAPPAPSGWTNVGLGARGATVAAIQRALMNAEIYLRGGADGRYGGYTRTAVQIFQRHYGIPATGVVDATTATQMGLFNGPQVAAATSEPPPWVDVAIGARGSGVRDVQRALINAGIFLRGGADGVFGVYTRNAVITFQEQRGVPGTGVVDAVTAQAMGLYTIPVPLPPPPPTEPPPPATEPPTTPAATEPPTTPAPPTTEAPTTTTEAPTTTTTTTTVAPSSTDSTTTTTVA